MSDSTRARDDVAHLVNEIRNELPLGREVQPIITEIDFENMPLMLVSMNGPPGFDERRLKELAEDVQEDLEGIQGVSNTQLFGGREREIHVNVIPDLFAQYNLSIGQVRAAVYDFHAEIPGGALNTSKFDLQVRNETKLRDVDDIADIVVANRDGRLIRIRDIATVEDTYRRRKSVAQLDGRETASIIVYKEANINSMGTAAAVKNRVAELRELYPHIQFSTTRDVSEDIGIMFYVLGSSAVFGAALILVILTLTMGPRISILVLIAIPFSSAIGLIALYVNGIAISNMVLFSFILVLGMVVDGRHHCGRKHPSTYRARRAAHRGRQDGNRTKWASPSSPPTSPPWPPLHPCCSCPESWAISWESCPKWSRPPCWDPCSSITSSSPSLPPTGTANANQARSSTRKS